MEKTARNDGASSGRRNLEEGMEEQGEVGIGANCRQGGKKTPKCRNCVRKTAMYSS